ncbi:hypothetical protein GGQ74_001017 [Desulfobaculum xiamenense]|uniref:Cytochrome c domain-containing protein n=1 Tax=Desulfobaculum xiamenense TaxID=995050 RepID=A0A846QJU1_9BACT|nr:hypothetical protein [Desulfobaculum xiamenense]NJB67377.1 hypothetical protein [Desulfobaculum xiamenense]
MFRNSVAVFVVVVVLCAPVKALAQDADPGGTLRRACVECHDFRRICRNLGEKSLAGWEKTVTRMYSKGAKIDAADIPALARHLHGLESGSGEICK